MHHERALHRPTLPTPKSLSRRAVLSGLAATPVALAVPSLTASAKPRRRHPVRPPTVVNATPHEGLTSTFTTYGNNGEGWSGADSTYSRRLPGRRHLWMFSDTFLGEVNDDGSRPADFDIVNNTFVVQRGDQMSTIHGGTVEEPEAVLQAGENQWYWLGGSYVGAGALNIMFIRFQRTGEGMWDWEWLDNHLGRISLRDYRVMSLDPMPSSAGVTWSSWLDRNDGCTYVYGTEDLGESKYMHVAKVYGADLRNDWQYFDGSGWSPNESDSARIMEGVANEYSVTRWNGGYLLVTHDTNELFSNKVLGYVSDSPTGPFTDPVLLYTTPETGLWGSYGDQNVITYNSHEHPELRRDNKLIITYNVNSLDFQGVLDDVTKYRPRFIEVTLAP
jgi:hypothetical protein